MKKAFLGIDVSTTASKALIIDESGCVLASHSSSHPVSNPHPLWSEQNPQDWWSSTKAAITTVLKTVPSKTILSIGLTGQMHGLVLLDKQGNVLRPAILWNDGRSFAECEEIVSLFGSKYLYKHIGTNVLPYLVAPKLLWVKKNEPKIYEKIAHILLPKDYIRFCLSNVYATDISDASGTGFVDIAKRAWSMHILNTLNIPFDWLPSLHESPEVCAFTTPAIHQELGIEANTPIVAGAGDQPAGGIGSGIIESNMISIAVGTSGVTFAINDCYEPEPEGRLNTFCHAIPGKWFHMGLTMSAAGSLHWLKEQVSQGLSYSKMDEMAEKVPRGASGLLFAPYLSGERHPYSDPYLRGGFIGLTLRHNLSHMIRSVLEGVAFSLKDTLKLMNTLGINPTSFTLTGGAGNSSIWKSIIAEVLGFPLYTLQANEGASLGAAILAAAGVQAWENIESACKSLIQKSKPSVPDNQGISIYQNLYPIYHDLYKSLSSISHQLTKFEQNYSE